MRITSKMTTLNVIENMQVNSEKLDKLNNQLSSGRRINIPEDDPAGTVKAMGYRGNLGETEQYMRNVDKAKTLLDATDAAFNDLTNIIQRVRELAVKGANETFEQSSRDAIADEINQILDSVYELGNTKVAGRYIFAGFQTMTQPFRKYVGSQDAVVGGPGADLTDIDGNVRTGINKNNTTVISYQGDSGRIQTEIGENVTTEANISGEEAFLGSGGGVNIFQTIMDLRDSLYQSDNVDNNGDGKSIQKSIDNLEKSINHLMKYRSEVGAKMQRMEQTENKLKSIEISVTELLAKTEDVDVTKAIMDLKVQESVQRMSLNVGARIIQPSLMDFLK